jgi:hypothetical protein
MVQLSFFNQPGFANANTLAPQKKRGKKMTKRNLLLVSLFLVFGFVVMAPCAMATAWVATANSARYLRGEGFAEAAGQVVITLATPGAVPGPISGIPASFTITYGAPVVAGSAEVICSGGNGIWSGGTCTGLGAPIYGTNSVEIWFQYGESFDSGDALAAQVAVTVRLDANAVAVCGTTVDVSAATEAFSPSTTEQVSLPVNGATNGLVAHVMCPSLSFTFDTYYNDGETAEVLTCIGVKEVASYANDFVLNVDEEFTEALTSQSTEWGLDNGGGINGTGATDVTNGSNFVVTFSNVPTGIGMKADDIMPCSTLPGPSKDSFYCAGGKLAISLISPAVVSAPTLGVISFMYEVTAVDMGSPESVDLSYKFWSHGPLPVSLGGTGITVNVAYAPPPPSPPPGVPYFTGLPELATPLTAVWFNNCATNLLYPFVTNYLAGPPYAFNNIGTEIFVANTTMDPLNTAALVAADQNPQEAEGTATPQSGTCTFWLFPNASSAFADGSAGTMASYTSPTIWAGGTYGFDMGSVAAFTGMTGYIYAKCGFQNAHGVEYITDHYGLGEPGYAASFDAIVIPTPEFYHRTPAGDGLGESAIAPLMVNKLVQKLLGGGVHNGPWTPGPHH